MQDALETYWRHHVYKSLSLSIYIYIYVCVCVCVCVCECVCIGNIREYTTGHDVSIEYFQHCFYVLEQRLFSCLFSQGNYFDGVTVDL